MEASRVARVALAGNPNSGKTSLFNALTGARQRVGNYPGVTVEKRAGSFYLDGTRFEVVDLPGTYSLASSSPEERVAQDELVCGEHDVVVVVVDSTNLGRHLVFLAQIMQTGARAILCLNMADEARRAGQRIDLAQMEALLGIPVLETVGHRGEGVDRLKKHIASALRAPPPLRSRLVLGERMESAIAAITAKLSDEAYPSERHPWVATRLLVEDSHVGAQLERRGVEGRAAAREAARQRQRIEAETGVDISLFVTERYFGFVDGLLREVMRSAPRADARRVSDRIDRVLVHRVLGLPVFAAVMYGIFWTTFAVGEIPMGWIEAGFARLGDWLTLSWPATWGGELRSLLVDGVIGGVGGVVVFLPNIVLLFLGLALLEDTGYMARAAFLMDRAMHRFGLHGKSFIPLVTGFGCSIPGIMATRVLDNERDRLTTMLVLPLMSCGARLPIWMLLIPAFFAPPWRAPMLWLVYSAGIVLALLLAALLRKSILRGEDAPFVMELPPYRLPTLRAAATKMLERAWIYLRKAGTTILSVSILMWVITAYPKLPAEQMPAGTAPGQIATVTVAEPPAAVAAESIDAANTGERHRAANALLYSVAGRIGRALEPFIEPLGFDWRLGTAMLGAFAAKEVFVAQLGIIYSMEEGDKGSAALRSALRRDYSPLVAVSLMLFLLIATPCMATLVVTRRESGSWRWAALQLGGLTAVAYGVSLVVFQVGSLLSGLWGA